MSDTQETQALTTADIEAIARQHGLLAAGAPLSPELQAFTADIVERCAVIGEQYGDADCNAGDHIRAELGNI